VHTPCKLNCSVPRRIQIFAKLFLWWSRVWAEKWPDSSNSWRTLLQNLLFKTSLLFSSIQVRLEFERILLFCNIIFITSNVSFRVYYQDSSWPQSKTLLKFMRLRGPPMSRADLRKWANDLWVQKYDSDFLSSPQVKVEQPAKQLCLPSYNEHAAACEPTQPGTDSYHP
jgi:hypothetical protein